MTDISPGSILLVGNDPYGDWGEAPITVPFATCPEEVTYDTNMLRDGGFENANEIGLEFLEGSNYDIGTPAYPTSGMTAYPNYDNVDFFSGDRGLIPEFDGHWWDLSTANPRTGTYHARYVTDGSNESSPFFFWVGLEPCTGSQLQNISDYSLMSARIDPGDTLDVSVWVRDTTSSGNSDVWSIQVGWVGKGPGHDFVGTTSVDFVAQGSTYSQLTFSPVAPADTVYAFVDLLAGPVGSSNGDIWDADDCSVVVTA